MKSRTHTSFAIIIQLLTFAMGNNGKAQQNGNLQYLKPEIGGVGHLLQPTRPTMQLPNQLIRMIPDRNDYLDDQISSFPLLVVSHRLGQVFSIKPNTDKTLTSKSWNEKLAYDQDLEVRNPWHYENDFVEKDIHVDFVPGQKVGIFKFDFSNTKNENILLGTYNGQPNYWTWKNQALQAMQIFEAEDGLQPVKVFIYGKFSQPTALQYLDNDQLKTVDSIGGNGQQIAFHFSPNTKSIEFKYAVSFISPEQAKENYESELGNRSLTQLADKGKAAWEKALDQIEIQGGSEAQKRSFVTALYRCYERMVNISEGGKYYSGYDNQIHSDKRDFYVDDWAWDTYLALHPLRTILNPRLESDMLQSYVRMYEQSGWLPTFPVIYGDHACMNGFHSSVMLQDAFAKGISNVDYKTGYEAMKKNSLQATMLPWRNGPATHLDSFYYQNGYFPALHKGEKEPYSFVSGFERRQAVAVTLGTSYDDWALAQMSKAMGKMEDYKLFTAKSKNYRNLWNADKKFFLPKDSAGNWIDIDPKWDGGPGGRDYYDENNGWTYRWQVAQDVPDLVHLMGGKKDFEQNLDQLFREDLGREKKLFWVKFTDATGLVGQYSMGNEPSFPIPYMYNYTDAPWKTQQRIRLLLNTWFYDDIFGIPGDEDGGGMSAFVVFSSMGFYPITPGKPIYAIGSPVFSKVKINLQNGKTFTMIANHCSQRNKYIQSATINGKKLDTPFITHQEIMNGGTLRLEMGDKPNKNWGVSH